MKYLDGKYDVEVKDHRYLFQPTKNIISRLKDEPKSLTTQYQVHNNTQIRKNQKVIKNENNELIVNNNPKNTTNSTTIKIQTTELPQF